MRTFIGLLLLALTFNGFSQNYNFKPQWKKGEKRNIEVSTHQKTFENDSLTDDSTTFNSGRVEIIEETKKSYTVEVTYDNQALQSIMVFYEKLDEELEEYNDLKLIYEVNKSTGKADLMNWEEVQLFMNNSFSAVTELLSEKMPEMESVAKMIFMPMEMLFNSKENIEDYMDPYIGFLFLPFKHELPLGDTLVIEETEENPFSPMQEVSATTLLTIETMDEQSKTAQIHQEIILDLSQFIEMMKKMINGMAEAFGVSDSSATSKTDEIDDFEMGVTNIEKISFDYESGWTTKVIKTGGFALLDPKTRKKTRTEVITTITIK